MSRLSVFVIGFICGAVGLFVSENYYIVRSKESVHLVRKVASKPELPYRDIRNYTTEDWTEDPSLALAIVNSKKENLLMDSGLSNVRRHFEDLLHSLNGN